MESLPSLEGRKFFFLWRKKRRKEREGGGKEGRKKKQRRKEGRELEIPHSVWASQAKQWKKKKKHLLLISWWATVHGVPKRQTRLSDLTLSLKLLKTWYMLGKLSPLLEEVSLGALQLNQPWESNLSPASSAQYLPPQNPCLWAFPQDRRKCPKPLKGRRCPNICIPTFQVPSPKMGTLALVLSSTKVAIVRAENSPEGAS